MGYQILSYVHNKNMVRRSTLRSCSSAEKIFIKNLITDPGSQKNSKFFILMVKVSIFFLKKIQKSNFEPILGFEISEQARNPAVY